jgi:lipid A disaccharide synthetase
MQCLPYADDIIFIDKQGIFDEPAALNGRVRYVGPIVRKFQYTRFDRERARYELGLPGDSTIVLVLPGQWFSEEKAPIFDLVMSAYRSIQLETKYLVWFAGEDYETLLERVRPTADVNIQKCDWQIDRWMVACDIAITKSTRKTAIELESLGMPSISLSYGLNVIDDMRVSRILTNTHIYVRETTPESLAKVCSQMIIKYSAEASWEAVRSDGLRTAAERIVWHIERARKRSGIGCRQMREKQANTD